ncbi:hypothetical protein FRB91_008627, partial [Serendipita sp. 411]
MRRRSPILRYPKRINTARLFGSEPTVYSPLCICANNATENALVIANTIPRPHFNGQALAFWSQSGVGTCDAMIFVPGLIHVTLLLLRENFRSEDMVISGNMPSE